MENLFEQRVFYSDTDAYGVVWHGAYLRWLEMGRVFFCDDLGLSLVELQNNDIVLPVTNLNVRYKSSAKLNDELIITTRIAKITALSMTFEQLISAKNSGKIFVHAFVDVVAVNNAGKLYRKLPEKLKSVLAISQKEDILCNV